MAGPLVHKSLILSYENNMEYETPEYPYLTVKKTPSPFRKAPLSYFVFTLVASQLLLLHKFFKKQLKSEKNENKRIGIHYACNIINEQFCSGI
jgi:hypothetical protein